MPIIGRRVATARSYARWISERLQEISLPGDSRTRAAAARFAIAQDHHESVALLVSEQLCASAFALVRIGTEAYVRGQWVRLCASDSQACVCVEANSVRWSMMSRLRMAADGFDGEGLSTLHSLHWRALCSYTHTGNQQLQRWITAVAIEASYSED